MSLFSWIVEQKDWDRLSGFPVFSLEEENDPTKRRGIKLEKVEMDAEGLLAPVKSWSEALQPYSDLFPRRYILADAYFETTSTSDTWEVLKERGFVKKDVIISKTKNIDFKKFHPDESLSRDENEEHKTLDDVTATNIAFLTKDEIGIMARIRQNQKLARLFWRFLTDWLVKHDAEGLVNSKAPCCCEGEHDYFPGEWLAPVKSNKWIPLGDRKSSLANAKSLASLLRDSELNISTLITDSLVIQLLNAIGVKPVDLMREFLANGDDYQSVIDEQLIRLMTATEGDLEQICELVEDLKNDPDLLDHLKERRERIRIVQKNQCLGRQVEELVKDCLKENGFIVSRTGIGSDYEIEFDLVESDEEIGLEIVGKNRRWLVEVKATRGHNFVRMTNTQAKTSVNRKKEFLLCVVPLEPGDAQPGIETVRANMRFVKDIGVRVKPHYNNLIKLEGLRNKITNDEPSDVQLVIESGTARIQIADTVWESNGFSLKKSRQTTNMMSF